MLIYFFKDLIDFFFFCLPWVFCCCAAAFSSGGKRGLLSSCGVRASH